MSAPRNTNARLPAPTTWWRRALRVVMYVAPFAGVAALGLPLCPVAILLQKPCPGCGVTRATYSFFIGDFAAAVAYQPLAFFICPVVAGLTAYHVGSYVRTGQWKWPRTESLIIASSIALMIVWAARVLGAFGGPVDV